MPKEVIDAVRAKISRANKNQAYVKHFGKDNGMYGKHHTIESKLKMSLNRQGKPAWNAGIKHSDETKQKISASLCGRKLSSEQKQHLSECLKGVKKYSSRKWTDSLCNEIRNLHMVGISYYQLGFILNKNAETVRISIRRFESEHNLPNSSYPLLMLSDQRTTSISSKSRLYTNRII